MEIGKELTQSELLALLQSFPSTLEVQYMIDAALEQKLGMSNNSNSNNSNKKNYDRCNTNDTQNSHELDNEMRSESLETNDLTPSRSTSACREMHHAHEFTSSSLSPLQDTESIITKENNELNDSNNNTLALLQQEQHDEYCTFPLTLLEKEYSSPPRTQFIKKSSNNTIVPNSSLFEQSAPQIILSPSSCESLHINTSTSDNSSNTSSDANNEMKRKPVRSSDRCDREWQELLIKTTIEEILNERLPSLVKEQVIKEVKKQVMENLHSSCAREQIEQTCIHKEEQQIHKQTSTQRLSSSPLAHLPPLAPTRPQNNYSKLYALDHNITSNNHVNYKENTCINKAQKENQCINRIENDNDREHNKSECNIIEKLDENDAQNNEQNIHLIEEHNEQELIRREEEEVCLSPVATLTISNSNITTTNNDDDDKNDKCLPTTLQASTSRLINNNSKIVRDKEMKWGLSVMDVPWFVLLSFRALRDVCSERKCGAVKVIAIAPDSPLHTKHQIIMPPQRNNEETEDKTTIIEKNVVMPCIEVNDVILSVNSISVSSCNVLETILSQVLIKEWEQQQKENVREVEMSNNDKKEVLEPLLTFDLFRPPTQTVLRVEVL